MSGEITALAYLDALGFNIFPCGPDKRPRTDGRDWRKPPPGGWTFGPDDLIGVALPLGTIVLDIDVPSRFEASGLIPDATVESGTRREGGRHLYYRTEGDAEQIVEGSTLGYDTRVGGKGYVIAWNPADWTAADEWSPAPTWLYGNPRQTEQREPVNPDAIMGTRLDILRWLGTVKANAPLSEGDLFAMLCARLNDGQIESLDPRRPWTVADMRVLAREAADFETHERGDLTEWLRRHETVSEAVEPDAEAGIEVHDVTHISVRPSRPQLFGRFGSPEGVTLGPFGDSGTGKSVLLMGMFLMAGTGRDVIPGLTPPLAPMKCLYLDYERRLIPNRRRLEMIARGAGIELPPDMLYLYEPTHNLDSVQGLEEVWTLIQKTGAELLFIDSGSYVSGLDPKDKAASDVISQANRAFGLPMIVPLHTPKNDRDPDKPYGSNYWPAVALETHSVVSIGGTTDVLDEDGATSFVRSPHTVVIRNRKSNDDEPGLPWAVTIGWPERIEGVYPPDAAITFTEANAGRAVAAYREKVARENGSLGGRPRVDWSWLEGYIIEAMPARGATYSKAEVRRDVEAAVKAVGHDVPGQESWSGIWKGLREGGLLVVDRMNVRRPG